MASFDKFGVALSSRVQVRVRLSFLFTFLTRSDPVSGDFSFIVLVSTTSMLSRPFYLTSGLAFHALQPYGALSTCPREIRRHLCHLRLPAFQPHRTLNRRLLRLRICRGRRNTHHIPPVHNSFQCSRFLHILLAQAYLILQIPWHSLQLQLFLLPLLCHLLLVK